MKNPGSSSIGYLSALGSAAVIATAFIIRKWVSHQINPATFGVWWYGFAGLYAWIFTLLGGQARQANHIRFNWKPLLGLIVFNAIAALLYFTEIDLTNPALVSFFGRLRTVYTVVLGIIVFQERFNRQEWIGAGVAVLGAVIIAYKGGATLNVVFLIALVENLMMAATTMMAKFAVQNMPPVVLAAYRGSGMSMLLLIYTLFVGQWQRLDGRLIALVAAGAFVSPFLGYVLRYNALARIGAGQVAVITASQPVFVTLYTAILLAQRPTIQQSLGGVLTIGGVVLILRAREHIRRKGKK